MSDYSISWGYIVSRMESLYGISPDSEEKVAFGEIEKRIAYIWQEYFEILYKEEFGTKMESETGEKTTHNGSITSWQYRMLNNIAGPIYEAKMEEQE